MGTCKVQIRKHELKFIKPGNTSRGTLYTKPSWFFVIQQDERTGVGECSVIPGLDPGYVSEQNYNDVVMQAADQIRKGVGIGDEVGDELNVYPSIKFGIETGLLDLKNREPGMLYQSEFTKGTKGIPINGLIWMGSKEDMIYQIKEKLDKGFRCLKLKIGSIDFDEEMDILKSIRNEYNPEELELRLDANGAFGPADALEKLTYLSQFWIHSVEQPIKPGIPEMMSQIVLDSPVPIALDEELIGVKNTDEKKKLLELVHPHFIILKPSLIGGFKEAEEWMQLARQYNCDWWTTSALESNVGLNAIAQWVFTQNPQKVQGLGTGMVFSNNIPSPLYLENDRLWHGNHNNWDWDILDSQ